MRLDLLYENDVVTVGSGASPLKLRVLRRLSDGRHLALIDIGDPGSWPKVIDVEYANEEIRKGAWTVEEGPAPIYPMAHQIDPSHAKKRDDDFAIVQAIVEGNEEAIFDHKRRAALMKAATASWGRSLPNIHKLVLRYMHRGMCKAALLPDWGKCGVPAGTIRPVKEGGKKRGRPRKGPKPGINIDERIRRLFTGAIDALYARNRKLDLKAAYRLCMRIAFLDRLVTEQGAPKHVVKEAFRVSGLPSLRQFRYWTEIDRDMLAVERTRATPRVWESKNRALLGTATGETWGPTARYLIDATVLDVYVRSRRMRRLIVGRPTLYVIIDVFSRMIVGLYIGLENASYTAAMMALANAARNKVEYCAEFGITIQEHDWPCNYIPAKILGDRGEMEKAGIQHALQTHNIEIENAAPYCAEWKGLLEKRFDLIQCAFAPYVPGYVEPDFRERGARDYRLDALLDIHDINRIVINLVLYFNNSHEIVKYPLLPGMIEDEVQRIPTQLWGWGLANTTGRPRTTDPDRFRYSLLPRSVARVTDRGIDFMGLSYGRSDCERVVQLVSKARRKGRFGLEIGYDKRDSDYIYIDDPSERGFLAIPLGERSPGFRGLSQWEAMAAMAAMAFKNDDVVENDLLRLADADAAGEAVVAEAKARPRLAPASARSQVSNIRGARQAELAHERRAEAIAFRPAPALPPPQPALALPAPSPPLTGTANGSPASEAGHARPSLHDRLANRRTKA